MSFDRPSAPTRGHVVLRHPPAGWTLIDLHNHTSSSYDASNEYSDYVRAVERGLIDVIAITDHNTAKNALALVERSDSRLRVIAGEEVDTADGELVGLFISRPLDVGRSAIETATQIREQGGLVYVQHPFYRLISRPLKPDVMRELARQRLIDIVEGINGGPLMRFSDGKGRAWAWSHGLPCGAGSDAHHPGDIGRCVLAIPTSEMRPNLTPESLMAGLEHGVLVDRRRRSVATLTARGRYAIVEMHGRARGRTTRKRRVPLDSD